MAYNKDTDYSLLMKQAADAGNYKLAAQYEQQRNEKIKGEGMDYATSSDYAGWLDSTDYGTIGQKQMAAGASWQDVQDTYNKRHDKASGTVGMEQYTNDAIQQEMLDYILAGQNQPSFDFDMSSKPTYNDNGMNDRINAMLDKILNRDAFSYSAATDPLYQQYASMYEREGTRAMNDAMAAAAATAGGMNTYAMTAANQANNYHMAQLGDKVPELYQLAYEMYLKDIDNQVRDLGLLQDMDDTQYGRYRDTMSDWYNDRDFSYGMYLDDVAKDQWNKTFNHGVAQDALAQGNWEAEFGHTVSEDALAQKNRDQEWDRTVGDEEGDETYEKLLEKAENLAAYGNFSGYKALGYTDEQIKAMEDAYNKQMAGELGGGYTGSTGGGGNDKSDSSSKDKTPSKDKNGGGYNNGKLTTAQVKELQDYYGATPDGLWGSNSKSKAGGLSADEAWKAYQKAIGGGDEGDVELNWSSMTDLGLGPVSASFVEEIMNAGGIVEDGKGNVYWAPGWGPDNYKEKMRSIPMGIKSPSAWIN